ncbi:hypothetical protein Hanom_Chr17g01572691 [Helianthus anomalus]
MVGADGDGDTNVTAALAGSPPPLDWKFSQVFGERTAGEEVQEAKLVSGDDGCKVEQIRWLVKGDVGDGGVSGDDG